MPLDLLRDTIQPFPTFSEAFASALADLGQRFRSSSSICATCRSSGVVTFRFSAGASWIRTSPPSRSINEASSVTRPRSSGWAATAWRSPAERNA